MEKSGSELVHEMVELIRELGQAAAKRTGLSRRRGREISERLSAFRKFEQDLEDAEKFAIAEEQEPKFDEEPDVFVKDTVAIQDNVEVQVEKNEEEEPEPNPVDF